MKTTLEVGLGARAYPIHIGRDLSQDILRAVRALRQDRRPVAVLVDANVKEHFGCALEDMFEGAPMLELPSGESTKCFPWLEKACNFLAKQKIDRSGVLFAVGGGVTGDLAGFAAASYLRGIEFYQVPTTLLAMVDSSVGGKTGINLAAGKNLVGAFWQPRAVFCDLAFLDTLPPREFSAGMAEVIKYGLLDDVELFEYLERLDRLHPRHAALTGIVRRCCEIKARIVEEDEQEKAKTGGRALLNLGHTFGHAIEAVAGYGDYLHGEAIAVGMMLAAELSAERDFIEPRDVRRIALLFQSYDLPIRLREALSLEALVEAMGRDKKVSAGKLKLVLMEKMGQAFTTSDFEWPKVEQLWRGVGAVDGSEASRPSGSEG
ncbi:MAG: 3-dehydroquinate synthase [Verrucomicrobiota bacterium JB022]|nr:3-dehydroquinate synthase [Verrucomicrobiota bacterium JB022]